MSNILLVGAGNLGRRYLQGLVSDCHPFSIFVLDQSMDALKMAKESLTQVQTASLHSAKFSTSLEDVPHQLDLAIIVTNADCRARMISDLASRYTIKSWILEKILAQSCKQLDHIDQALAGNSQVWVNTPRRLMAWHQTILSQLMPDGKERLKVRVSGGSWGLACNAIHFIDLVSWWTQASVNSVGAEGLCDWVQSKRPGFHEVFGLLWVTFSDGSELELSCQSGTDPLHITVATPQGEWKIEESAGNCVGPVGQQLQGQISFQSALTAPLVKRILQSGRCDLPTLAESSAQHRPLLTALLQHWNQNQGCRDSIVPIT